MRRSSGLLVGDWDDGVGRLDACLRHGGTFPLGAKLDHGRGLMFAMFVLCELHNTHEMHYTIVNESVTGSNPKLKY